jgi:hypothetical protein
MTDTRWPDGRSTMSRPHTHAVWEAPDRAAALAAAVDAHGEGGSKMRGEAMAAALAPSDLALLRDPEWVKETAAAFSAMFAHGLEGYTDDRLADGPGWATFDVTHDAADSYVSAPGTPGVVSASRRSSDRAISVSKNTLDTTERGHWTLCLTLRDRPST